MEAINKYRVRQAKKLLCTGNYLVAEVAAMFGVDDPAYFSNVFTRYTGTSPKKYQQTQMQKTQSNLED